jgi:4-amino-4-deoxy-L-arabinose transferase-like glycosyltransferase
MERREERDDRFSRFLRLLFLLSLLLRIAFVWQIRDLPTQRWLVMDAQRYDELAHAIAAGGWMPREAFYQAPLYPYFLAVVHAMAGERGGEGGALLAVRLLQAVCGAVTVVLLALLAKRLFGDTAGRAAGVLAALYGPAIFYVPLLLKSTLTLLALSGAVLLLIPESERPGLRRTLASGLLLGVSALLQENLILLIPFVALWLLLSTDAEPHRPRLLRTGSLVLGAVLGLAPATLLNLSAGGELVVTSSQGGMNFYIGNARGASGTYAGLSAGSQNPESQREDARRMAAGFASRERARPIAAEELSPGEVSGLFWRESWREIRADPAAWGRLLLRKTRLFWNAHEIPDAEGYDVYRREAGPLALFWLGFGVVAPLGLAGLGLAWKDPGPAARQGARLLTLLTLGLFLSVVLFFVFGRYRLPVVVLLIPPAGHALAVLVEAVRRREHRRLLLPLALGGIAALAVNLPAWPAAERARLDSAIWFNLSSSALRGAEISYESFRQGATRNGGRIDDAARADLEEALLLVSRAADDLGHSLEGDPGFFVARVQRAAALHRRGAYLASVGALEPALESYAEARRELDTALASGGGQALPEAERQARELGAALETNTAAALANRARSRR